MSDQVINRHKAFVLMPFDPEFDAVFNKLIKSALTEVGYTVTRADSNPHQQNILKDIIRGIAEANLVVADLTSLNANVFYEIGISHTLGRPTILISQSSEDIPFDLKAYRVITYSTHFKDAHELTNVLKKIGEQVKKGELVFGNPVSDFLHPLKLQDSQYEIKSDVVAVLVDDTSQESDDEEKGILDFIVENERSIQELIECAEKISIATGEMGQTFKIETAEIEKLKEKRGALGTASLIHKSATNVARHMVKYSSQLESEEPKLQKAWGAFYENISGLINRTVILSKEDKESAISYRSNIGKLLTAIQYSSKGARGFRDTIAQLKGLNKDMNRAIRRTVNILDLLISDFENGESFCIKTMTLLDEKIEREGKHL